MKILLPRILFTFSLFIFATIEIHSCDIISFIAPERLCLDRAGTFRGNGVKEPGCGTMTTQNIKLISGPGTAQIDFTTDENNEAIITFSEVGTYVLEYSFKDEDGCGTTECTMQATTEVFYPTASFVEDTIKICEGGTVEALINFVDASSVSVRGQGQINVPVGTGGVGTYNTFVQVFESFVLTIVSAQESTCENETLLDSLFVEVLKTPELIPTDTICNETNEFYIAEYELTGGDGTYTLLNTEIGSITGNTLTTISIPEGESFSYKIDSGPTCGEFEGSASATCECKLKAGIMQIERVEACEDDIITVEHDKTNLDRRPTDSVIYVLHNNDQAEIGAQFGLSYEPSFALPNTELADSQLYISVVVGPFTTENFNINDIECKVVSVGTPIRWFSKDEFSISGKLEVCAGEKNRMYTVNVSDELVRERDALFWYTSDGSGVVVESQRNDRAFVSFPTATSSGQLYYQIDRQLDDRICSSVDSVAISVDGTSVAPEESEIILWPGDIFASTSEGPCYQWGFIDRFANFSFNYLGENSKYFYSDQKIGQQNLIERAYFVAIYDTPDCEFSLNNCNSITFYNQNVLNGLQVGVKDDFELNIAPNPSRGIFRLEILGNYQGRYNVEVFNEIGRKVHTESIAKDYLRAIRELDLREQGKGMYFTKISNERGEYQIVKTMIIR